MDDTYSVCAGRLEEMFFYCTEFGCTEELEKNRLEETYIENRLEFLSHRGHQEERLTESMLTRLLELE